MEGTIKQEDSKLSVAPYWEILKTRGFWALQFTWLGALWGNFTLWTLIPLYLNNIQHFPLNAVSNLFICLMVAEMLHFSLRMVYCLHCPIYACTSQTFLQALWLTGSLVVAISAS